MLHISRCHGKGHSVCDSDSMDTTRLAACGVVAAVTPVPELAHRKPCLGFVSVLLCGVWAFQRYVFGSFPGESVLVTSQVLPSGLCLMCGHSCMQRLSALEPAIERTGLSIDIHGMLPLIDAAQSFHSNLGTFLHAVGAAQSFWKLNISHCPQ